MLFATTALGQPMKIRKRQGAWQVAPPVKYATDAIDHGVATENLWLTICHR